MNGLRTCVAAACAAACVMAARAEAPLTMRYASSASVWNEALPLGNGRIGAMVYGAPGMERVELNEETYWAGGPHPQVVKGLRPLIDAARRRILDGDAQGAYDEFVRQTGNRVATQRASPPVYALQRRVEDLHVPVLSAGRRAAALRRDGPHERPPDLLCEQR